MLLFTRRLLLPILMMAALMPHAGAATVAGVTLPDTYPVDGQPLPLNGIGLRTVTILHVRIYVAGLYLARPSHDAQQILSSSSPKVILMQSFTPGQRNKSKRNTVRAKCTHARMAIARCPSSRISNVWLPPPQV